MQIIVAKTELAAAALAVADVLSPLPGTTVAEKFQAAEAAVADPNTDSGTREQLKGVLFSTRYAAGGFPLR